MIRARYAHTNIVAKNWQSLAEFYETVFGCIRIHPERDLSGSWLDQGTGVSGARIRGVHLRLPGYDDSGPTLEILSYDEAAQRQKPLANRLGLGHIAFSVDDVKRTRDAVLQAGGKSLGQIASAEIAGAGRVTFVYLTDPEGNIIEIQRWNS